MIKPPNYKKDAIPTPRGWRHPRTKEMLQPRRILQVEINEYLEAITPKPVEVKADKIPAEKVSKDLFGNFFNKVNEQTEAKENMQQLNEAPPTKALTAMNKTELQELAQHQGVSTSGKTKKALLEDLK